MMDEMGAGGVFLDGFMIHHGGSFTYDRWDGHTVEIDPKTKTITRKLAALNLLCQDAYIVLQEARVQRGRADRGPGAWNAHRGHGGGGDLYHRRPHDRPPGASEAYLCTASDHERGRIDLDLSFKTPQARQLAFEPLCEDSLVLACARRSSLAQAVRLELSDLAGVPLIRYLPGMFMREVIDAHLPQQ
jgi:hypothetical protein